MLEIVVPETELYDEEKEKFVIVKETTLQLEHSLISISKWESKWHKPFLKQTDKRTAEEMKDYVKCMTLTQKVPDNVFDCLTEANLLAIKKYINDPMTASTISRNDPKMPGGGNNGVAITSELIYYDMIALAIPFECQKWHLNRLIMLIRICKIRDQSPKKMSRNSTISQYAALNAARRKSLGTRG